MSKKDAPSAGSADDCLSEAEGKIINEKEQNLQSLREEVVRLKQDRDRLETELKQSRQHISGLEANQKDLLKRLDVMEDMILSVLNND